MKYRIFCVGVLAAMSVTAAPSSAGRISEIIEKLNAILEAIARSSVLVSPQVDPVNELFLSTIRQNPSIQVMTRVGPDGAMINHGTAEGIGRRSINVREERWFKVLGVTRRPYAGISRDSSGNVFFFHAWPLLEAGPSVPRYRGALTVKIDMKELILETQAGESEPVQIRFRGTPLFSRNWDDGIDAVEDTVRFMDGEYFIIRSLRRDILTEEGRHQAARGEAVPAVREPAPVSRGTAAAKQESVPAADDSFRELQSIAAIILINVLALLAIVGFVVFTIFWSRRHRREDRELHEMLRQELLPSTVTREGPAYDDPAGDECPAEPVSLAEITSIERETRALPAIKELIAEASKKLDEFSRETDPGMRREIFLELRENLSLWIRSELKRLAGHLNQLSRLAGEYEAKKGRLGELRLLRNEILAIVREIDNLDKKIPGKVLR